MRAFAVAMCELTDDVPGPDMGTDETCMGWVHDEIGRCVGLDGARVAVAGFGAVGAHAARFLGERGARLVATSDSKGTVIDPDGLDVEQLRRIKARGGSVSDLPQRG